MSNNAAPTVALGIDADETTSIERVFFLGSFVEAATGNRISVYRSANCDFEIVELPVTAPAPPSTRNWRAVARGAA